MKQLYAFIKSARFAEVSILLGFPMIGLFFAFKSADQLFSPDVFLFVLAIFALFYGNLRFQRVCRKQRRHPQFTSFRLERKTHFFHRYSCRLALGFITDFLFHKAGTRCFRSHQLPSLVCLFIPEKRVQIQTCTRNFDPFCRSDNTFSYGIRRSRAGRQPFFQFCR